MFTYCKAWQMNNTHTAGEGFSMKRLQCEIPSERPVFVFQGFKFRSDTQPVSRPACLSVPEI